MTSPVRDGWPAHGPPARYATPRSDRPSHGPAAALVARALGRPLMPWQRQVADVALEVDPATGLYVYDTVIATVQRQCGKTTLTGAVGTHRALTKKRARIWYTAQTGKDAGEWLRDEYLSLLSSSAFAGRYRSRLSQGAESVIWPNDSVFRAFPPLRDALHGKQSDLVFVDEAWAHDDARGDELKQAIRPTQATRPGAQTWVLSTAGDADSAMLASYVELGRASVAAGRRTGVAYFEWSIPDDVDPDDIVQVAAHHPAVGFTIDAAVLRAARDEMKPGEFARAYGNRWTATAERVIPTDAWQECAVDPDAWQPPPLGVVGLAFEVDVERRDASIAAAWRDTPDGPIRVDVIDHRTGDWWVAERLAELREKWRAPAVGYNARGPAVDIADEVRRAGVQLLEVNTTDYVAACAGLLADVVNHRLRHPSRQVLDDAAGAAAQRNIGDAWAWAPRRSAGSISPLAAATVARWTYDHRPPPAARPVIATRRR